MVTDLIEHIANNTLNAIKEINMKAFEELKDILKNYNLETVADVAGVHFTTLYNWLSGKTKNPHLRTFIKVAKAMGFEVMLRREQVSMRRVA